MFVGSARVAGCGVATSITSNLPRFAVLEVAGILEFAGVALQGFLIVTPHGELTLDDTVIDGEISVHGGAARLTSVDVASLEATAGGEIVVESARVRRGVCARGMGSSIVEP